MKNVNKNLVDVTNVSAKTVENSVKIAHVRIQNVSVNQRRHFSRCLFSWKKKRNNYVWKHGHKANGKNDEEDGNPAGDY